MVLNATKLSTYYADDSEKGCSYVSSVAKPTNHGHIIIQPFFHQCDGMYRVYHIIMNQEQKDIFINAYLN